MRDILRYVRKIKTGAAQKGYLYGRTEDGKEYGKIYLSTLYSPEQINELALSTVRTMEAVMEVRLAWSEGGVEMDKALLYRQKKGGEFMIVEASENES